MSGAAHCAFTDLNTAVVRPGLPADQVATLAKLVTGVDRMAMSPYPDLKTPISLHEAETAW